MNTTETTTGIPPDVAAELQEALDKLSKGIRDPEAAKKARERAAKEQAEADQAKQQAAQAQEDAAKARQEAAKPA